MIKKIYLDYNATCPILPEVISAVADAMAVAGNASSIHSHGRDARKLVEEARRSIGATIDVSPQQIIFTSGATEANNTVLRSFSGQRILVSSIEHPSVIESGVEVISIPVTPNGLLDLGALEQLLTEAPTALVSVMLVNNETGVIQPVAKAAQLAKSHGAKFHCDAVQAYGRIPLTREATGADYLTLSAHKIGGPHGVGALVIAPGTHFEKLLQGGGQERRQRAGTENVAAIAGFGVAAEKAHAALPSYFSLAALRDRIEAHVSMCPAVTVYGRDAERTANTLMFSVRGIPSDTLLMAFDLEGVSVSSGSACSSGTTRFSYVLEAMGVTPSTTLATVRVSLGWGSQEKDVEHFCAVWDKLRERLIKE